MKESECKNPTWIYHESGRSMIVPEDSVEKFVGSKEQNWAESPAEFLNKPNPPIAKTNDLSTLILGMSKGNGNS